MQTSGTRTLLKMHFDVVFVNAVMFAGTNIHSYSSTNMPSQNKGKYGDDGQP